jgi:4-hydroxybenzoate polyprenyltransferase
MNRLALYVRLIRLDKPIGILLLLWPTLSALWFASNGKPDWMLVTIFTLGTVLMRSAGCAINDFADRDFDRHVKRTAERPLTSGRIAAWEAVMVAVVLALVSFALILPLNTLTREWSVAAVLIAASYPYFKRFFAIPQAYLGIAFGFGIPMAFAAVRGGDAWTIASIAGAVPALAWWLLFGNLFWVLAYDTEYAMVDRDDDIRVGAKSTAILFGDADLPIIGVLMVTFVLAMLLVAQRGHLHWPYFAGVGIAAGLFTWQQWLMRAREREACLRAFRNNNWVGLALWVGIVLSYALK